MSSHLPAEFPMPMRVCFVGDSFVNGTDDPTCLGWTGRVCAAAWSAGHEVTLYNLGVRRDTSAEIAARWEAEVTRRLPVEYDGRVIFSFGVNDTTIEEGRQRVETATALSLAETMFTAARQRYPLLVVGPPPMPDREHTARIEDYSRRLARLCATLDVPYLETCGSLLARPEWLREAEASDGAHPGAAGYAALADLVLAWSGWQAWFRRKEG